MHTYVKTQRILAKIGENLRYQVFKNEFLLVLIEISSFDAKILKNQVGYYKRLLTSFEFKYLGL